MSEFALYFRLDPSRTHGIVHAHRHPSTFGGKSPERVAAGWNRVWAGKAPHVDAQGRVTFKQGKVAVAKVIAELSGTPRQVKPRGAASRAISTLSPDLIGRLVAWDDESQTIVWKMWDARLTLDLHPWLRDRQSAELYRMMQGRNLRNAGAPVVWKNGSYAVLKTEREDGRIDENRIQIRDAAELLGVDEEQVSLGAARIYRESLVVNLPLDLRKRLVIYDRDDAWWYWRQRDEALWSDLIEAGVYAAEDMTVAGREAWAKRFEDTPLPRKALTVKIGKLRISVNRIVEGVPR